MSADRVWFVAERFERLAEVLMARGYALDPGARDPNEWNELAREDPPLGIVRMKGVRLADPSDEESEFDRSVSFSIEEYWASDPVDGALMERGYYLVSYSYHGHHHGVDCRDDFDPILHPGVPYHHHPPSSLNRQPSGPTSPEEALDRFERWIASHSA